MTLKHALSLLVALTLVLAVPAGLAADNIVSSLGFTVYYEGDPESEKIAITVDDLYGLDHLESILDLCVTYDIRMTFFPVGAVIKPENAALWQRIVDEGHEIGNHTYSHPNITKISADKLSRQLRYTQSALNEVLQSPYTMRLFRPPFGKYQRSRNGSTVVLPELGYPHVVMWTVDSNDTKTAYRKTKSGSILLFHTNRKDVRCLTRLIPQFLDKGLQPVTVSQLLNLPPMETQTSHAD